jgi:ribosomal protein S18 acetylase RimI-like enzyme
MADIKMNLEIKQHRDIELIRPIIEEVQNLHAQLYPQIYRPYSEQNITKAMKLMMENNDIELWVVFANDVAVGYMLLMLKNIADNAFYFSHHILHVDQLAVLKSHQRMGVGAALLAKAESIAIENNIRRLELDHLYLNKNAAIFFEENGFQPYQLKLIKYLP